MINAKKDKNLAEWQKLQEIGVAQAKKFSLDSEEKIVESLQIVEPKVFMELFYND